MGEYLGAIDSLIYLPGEETENEDILIFTKITQNRYYLTLACATLKSSRQTK